MNLRILHDEHGKVCNHCLKGIDDNGKSTASYYDRIGKDIVCETDEEMKKPLPKNKTKKKTLCKHCGCRSEIETVHLRVDDRPEKYTIAQDHNGNYTYYKFSDSGTSGTWGYSDGYNVYTGGK